MDKSITITEVRNQIIDKFNPFFTEMGYRVNKSRATFTRNSATTIVSFEFKTYSYYPSHCEYTFICRISLKELNSITSLYNSLPNKELEVSHQLEIVEGEFIHDLLEKERKLKRFYTNEIRSEEDMKYALDQSFAIIKNEVLPIISLNNTLESFLKNYLLPHKLVERLNEPDFLISCLLAASQIDIDFYFEMETFLKVETEKMERQKGVKFSGLDRVMEQLNSFVKSHYQK